MSKWALLAPGPSARREDVERAAARGLRVGVVSNAFELYPEADFLAASDRKWWRKHPQAMEFWGQKYAAQDTPGVKRVRVPSVVQTSNSGVLALEVAVLSGADYVELYGFDMHGSHFFGRYKNGLANTSAARRQVHSRQYQTWAQAHPGVQVLNCTRGSALLCFEKAV